MLFRSDGTDTNLRHLIAFISNVSSRPHGVLVRARLGRITDPHAGIRNQIMDRLMATTEIHREKRKEPEERLHHIPRECLGQRHPPTGPIIDDLEVHDAVAQGPAAQPHEDGLIKNQGKPPYDHQANAQLFCGLEKRTQAEDRDREKDDYDKVGGHGVQAAGKVGVEYSTLLELGGHEAILTQMT